MTDQITPGSGLTADEAARRARATSHEVGATAADARAAQAAVEQARAGYLPRLTATGRYTRLSEIEQVNLGNIVVVPADTPAGPITPQTPLFAAPLEFPVLLNNYELSAQLTVPVSDYLLRVPPAVAAAKDGQRAAELSSSATLRKVDTDARAAYYTWVRARLSVAVAEQNVEQTRAHLEDVKKAFAVGSASRADVLRVESLVAQAELGLVRAKNFAELAEARLRTVMHDTSNAPLAIGEDVLADLPETGEDIDALTRRALAGREELHALDQRVASVRDGSRVTRAAYLPRLDVFAGATYANPNQRIFPQEDKFKATWQAGAQLTWTPSDIPGTAAQRRGEEARAAALEEQRALLADGVRIEVLTAWQAVKEARAAIETSVKTLGTAEESYRVRRALYQNGRATTLELTDAELDLTRARLDAVNARVDLRIARAQLARALGGGEAAAEAAPSH